MFYEKLDSELCEGVLQVPNFFCCLIILYPIKKTSENQPIVFFRLRNVSLLFVFINFCKINLQVTSSQQQVSNSKGTGIY